MNLIVPPLPPPAAVGSTVRMPTLATVSAPVLCREIEPAPLVAVLERIVQLFVKVSLLTLMVMLLLDTNNTLAETVVDPAVLVVVTAPPFMLMVVVPLPADFPNVSDWPLAADTLIVPPLLDIVVEKLSGPNIVRGVVRLFIVIALPVVAPSVIMEPAPRLSCAVLIVKAPVTVSVLLAATLIVPPHLPL